MNTKYIERFMQANYSDEKLAALLAHAQDGKLSYYSCCCFVGAATSGHALCGVLYSASAFGMHLEEARQLPFASLAEVEFCYLSPFFDTLIDRFTPFGDYIRRKRIIPIIEKEMKRREQSRDTAEIPAEELTAK